MDDLGTQRYSGGMAGRVRALGLSCKPLQLLVQVDTMRQEPRRTASNRNLLLDLFAGVEAHERLLVCTVARLGGDELCVDRV